MRVSTKSSMIVVPLAMILQGCGGTVENPAQDPREVATLDFDGAHIMPVHPPGEEGALTVPPNAHLNYYGGPVISNVRVVTVFWGSRVNFQSQLNSFYGAVTNSTYFDWLNEYNTQSQRIRRGSLRATFVDTTPPAGSTITNAQIQSELARLLNAGRLPANDPNTLYMVHFPPGISINLNGSRSCQVFCAYHNTFVNRGANVYYGVMPDMGGPCARGCGSSSQLDNTTSVSSHELIESVTDPAVGLATRVGPPLAWYDPNNGEIGDICNGMQTRVSSFAVQLEWSNRANRCTATGQ